MTASERLEQKLTETLTALENGTASADFLKDKHWEIGLLLKQSVAEARAMEATTGHPEILMETS